MQKMKIEKSGFYNLSKQDLLDVEVSNNLTVIIFYIGLNPINLKIGENSKVEYYGFLSSQNNLELNIYQDSINSSFKLRYLFFSKDNQKIIPKITSFVKSSETKTDLKIISIAGENGFIDIDGNIVIDKNLKNIVASLNEENIFLGNTGTINGLPTLMVKSNEVQASHSCKIHKIDENKLFYLTSKGISYEKAKEMFLEAYFVDLFRCISMTDKVLYEELREEFFELLK